MQYLALAALLTAVAAFSVWNFYRTRRTIHALQISLGELERAVVRHQASVTVKRTQEILTSRYTHDRVSARTVTPSPLVRKINHARVEEVQPAARPS